MAIIKSGATTDLLTIDPTSKAARMTNYGTDGTVYTNIGKKTYCAATEAFAPGATPTDVFTITGSGTKVVRVVRMIISSVQTSAGYNSWFITKRSAANTGGTSTSVTAVPNDSANSAASATVLNYTAAPTLGAEVGDIWSGKIFSQSPAPGSGPNLSGLEVDFVDIFGQPIALRTTSEVLAWNFNGAATPTGLTLLCVVQWTEE